MTHRVIYYFNYNGKIKEFNVFNGTLDECNDYIAEVKGRWVGQEFVFKIVPVEESAEYFQEY